MNIILGLMVALVLGTVGFGMKIYVRQSKIGSVKKALVANISMFIPLVGSSVAVMIPKLVYAANGAASGQNGLGLLAVALSTGLATLGAGYAVGTVGSAALGVVSEDEKILGKTLIFVGLAEGIAIYGLIISILILGRL